MNQKILEEYYSYDDFCESCAEERKAEGLTPNIKIQLPNATMRKGIPVTICPYCDGEALGIARRNTKEGLK